MKASTVIRLITLAVVAGGWELAATTGLVSTTVLPSLSSVIVSLVRSLGQHATWYNAYVSVWEIGFGLIIGVGAGLAFAILAGLNTRVWSAFEPMLYYLGSLPKIIVLPVLLLYLSIGVYSKVGMAAVSAFFPVAITAAHALHEVDDVHIKAARTLGASRLQLLAKVYTPAAIGPVLSGLRLGLAVAVTGVLLAETSVATAGLGYLAIQDYDNLQISDMYALLMLVFIAAVGVNALLGWLIRRVTKYQQPAPERVFFT
jgi:ABC-type nitrate/sulfonate/bicarbonate transport system permease component